MIFDKLRRCRAWGRRGGFSDDERETTHWKMLPRKSHTRVVLSQNGSSRDDSSNLEWGMFFRTPRSAVVNRA